ncbi:MAG TPA: S1C family serine protease [Actinomycetota bacterium]
MMRRVSTILALVAACAVFVAPAPAPAVPTWAPASTATIHPGVRTVSDGNQCSANFVFYDATSIYIGQAAHCTSSDAATATDGCEAIINPGVRSVTIQGASKPGQMVYSSWSTMQARGETNPDACRFNDFALVRIDPADAGKVNPTVPFWGGPSLPAASTGIGQKVYGYGNSDLWFGISALKPHEGVSLGTTAGWSHDIYTAPPGIPGDSGSAYLDAFGRALGILSTVEATPLAGSNNLTDLARALSYMRTYTSFSGVQLAAGTVAFAP